MVNHGYDRSGDPNHSKNVYILQILELIPGFRGSSGKGVRSRKPDPPKHAQESSDDVSSQQTPSSHKTMIPFSFHLKELVENSSHPKTVRLWEGLVCGS